MGRGRGIRSWELLSVATGGNSLAQESSSRGREQVVRLPEETDTANAVGRASPGVRIITSTTPAFSLMLVYTGHSNNNSLYFIIATMYQHSHKLFNSHNNFEVGTIISPILP